MTKVLMIIAPENFRDEEYFTPKKIFEEAGFEVTTASTKTQEIRGSKGGLATSDLALKMVNPEDYEAVILVGGQGASEYFEDEEAHSLLRGFAEAGKITAAICISPNTLANAGLLEGKKATVWKDDALIENLKDKGANYTGLTVTIDLPIVTANGPEAAEEFAKEIVSLIEERQA